MLNGDALAVYISLIPRISQELNKLLLTISLLKKEQSQEQLPQLRKDKHSAEKNEAEENLLLSMTKRFIKKPSHSESLPSLLN